MAERVVRRKRASGGALTRRELEVVQGEWRQVERAGQRAAALLYEHLFFLDPTLRELDPTLRELFGRTHARQQKRLFNFVGAAVHGLGQPDLLLPIVRHLGRKHRAFGVEDHDYATFGVALLWMLRDVLGSAFGAESVAAWIAAYTVISRAMKEGRSRATPSPRRVRVPDAI